MKFFAEPIWLTAGLLVAAAVGMLLWWSEQRKKARLRRFAASPLLPKLAKSHSAGKAITRSILLAMSVVFLFLALAQPQWGTRRREATPSGIDILIALDVSRSMLARDVRPNRIERVKLGLSNLLDIVKGDRLGLIAFAGNSFLQCPLTLDHSALRRTLRELEVGLIKRQGTDLAQPIEQASRSFSKDDNDRFLILVSDGEDLEAKGLRTAKEAAKKGVRIYTIGIGSMEGARIPTDLVHEKARNFLKDPEGNVIVTKLDKKSLQAIAEATGGKYFSLGPTGQGLEKVFKELQAIGHRKRHTLLSQELPIERFQPFLLLALIFLLSEFFLGNRRRMVAVGPSLAVLLLLLLPGCLRKDNVKRAEEAHDKKEFSTAANFYEAEIEATQTEGKTVDPRLRLNAGLAHLDAGNLEEAEEMLEDALDGTVNEPALQSKVLNALGNLHYAKANQSLDKRDVTVARKAWGKALRNYDAAVAIDDNPKAKDNREKLAKQLEERIKSLISRVWGMVWRDIDGNGRPQGKEPRLPAKIYWDKNGDGEHNASTEPFIENDERGRYGIEWISHSYPPSLQLGCTLGESNSTKEVLLLPILPPPPPPQNPDKMKTQIVEFEKAGEKQIHFPFRAAPMLKGFVWNDADKDGRRDDNETGYAEAKLFLDLDGNLSHDQNETSFKPSDSGKFSQVVPPGQHVLCIQVKNEDGNMTQTFPPMEQRAHLAFVDFETAAEHLDFGVYVPNYESNESQQNQPESNPQENPEEQEGKEEKESETASSAKQEIPKEVNALYERLLQEIDASAEQLDFQGRAIETPRRGRDY